MEFLRTCGNVALIQYRPGRPNGDTISDIMNKHRAIIDRSPNLIDRYFYVDRVILISIGALYAISGIQHQIPEEGFV